MPLRNLFGGGSNNNLFRELRFQGGGVSISDTLREQASQASETDAAKRLQEDMKNPDIANTAPKSSDEIEERCLLYSELVNNVLKGMALKGLDNKDGSVNILPGGSIDKQSLKDLRAAGKRGREVRDQLYKNSAAKFKKEMESNKNLNVGSESQRAAIYNGLTGSVYKSLYNDADPGFEERQPNGYTLNDLLDIRIEPGKTIRQLKTNCVWYVPDDIKTFPKAVQNEFDPEVMRNLGAHLQGQFKSDFLMIEETVRIASIPCHDDPTKLLCFDSNAMFEYLNSYAFNHVPQPYTTALDLLKVAKSGQFDGKIPVPRETQKCAGAKYLNRDQIIMVLEQHAAAQVLKDKLPSFPKNDIKALLAMKEELIVIPPAAGLLASVWEKLGTVQKKIANHLPALLKSLLAFSLIRWIVCALLKVTFLYCALEKAGVHALKKSLKSMIKPIFRGFVKGINESTKNISKDGLKLATSKVSSLFGLNVDFAATNAAIEKLAIQNDKGQMVPDQYIDQAIDSCIDLIMDSLKGFGVFKILMNVALSMKAQVLGSPVTQIFEFFRGFWSYGGTITNLVFQVAADGVSSVAGFMNLPWLQTIANAPVFLARFRDYCNPMRGTLQDAKNMSQGISYVAKYLPGGPILSASISGVSSMLFEGANPYAVMADSVRMYLPTLQYAAQNVTRFFRGNWADIDAGSVSFFMLQFLPRCCGLLSVAAGILLFDPRTLVPSWVTKTLPSWVTNNVYVQTAGTAFQNTLSMTSDLLPKQLEIAVGLKAYTKHFGVLGSKSICETFADELGGYIDIAVVSVLVVQILMDIGCMAYLIRYKEPPPLMMQTSCLKLFSEEQQGAILQYSAGITNDDREIIAKNAAASYEKDILSEQTIQENLEEAKREAERSTYFGAAKQISADAIVAGSEALVGAASALASGVTSRFSGLWGGRIGEHSSMHVFYVPDQKKWVFVHSPTYIDNHLKTMKTSSSIPMFHGGAAHKRDAKVGVITRFSPLRRAPKSLRKSPRLKSLLEKSIYGFKN